MPEEVRIWEILEHDRLRELERVRLDLEKRIENWLEQDISVLSDDLLVFGRQVTTDYGGIIDLLCLDSNGDVVIVELKRDKTSREITAQILDYASWVKELSNEQVTELADKYLGDHGPLNEAFERKFENEFPETLNQQHKMLVVGSEIDASTERIIGYLSDTYGVDINAVTFQYLKDEASREYLARLFLIEPSQVERSARTRTRSKRRRNLTKEELQSIAASNNVKELYDQLAEGLEPYFKPPRTTLTTLAFKGSIGEGRYVIFSLAPDGSSAEQGLRVHIYPERLIEYFETDRESLLPVLPAEIEGVETTEAGYFRTSQEIDQFLSRLRELKRDSGE